MKDQRRFATQHGSLHTGAPAPWRPAPPSVEPKQLEDLDSLTPKISGFDRFGSFGSFGGRWTHGDP